MSLRFSILQLGLSISLNRGEPYIWQGALVVFCKDPVIGFSFADRKVINALNRIYFIFFKSWPEPQG